MIRTQQDVTPAVLAVMEQTPDPRLRQIMISLVTHLHGFIRDTRLTETEFREATEILNNLGKASTDTHNEPVLMAGALGVSSLVCLLNNGNNGTTETTQNLLGPFWRMNSPATENGASLIRSETPGTPVFVNFLFQDQNGNPIEGAKVDIWHSSPVGLYENQDESQENFNLRGQFTTNTDGRLWFSSIKPAGYPVPTHAVVGKMLAAQNRHPYRPAHIHALAVKQGYKTLITQIYADDDPKLHSDVAFGVTAALASTYIKHSCPHPNHSDITEWYALDHTLVMEPGDSTIPKPPIK